MNCQAKFNAGQVIGVNTAVFRKQRSAGLFQIEHIIARQHRKLERSLLYSIRVLTNGRSILELASKHVPKGIEIEGLTPTGRTTVQVLGMNEEMRQMLRYELWCEGQYGTPDRVY